MHISIQETIAYNVSLKCMRYGAKGLLGSNCMAGLLLLLLLAGGVRLNGMSRNVTNYCAWLGMDQKLGREMWFGICVGLTGWVAEIWSVEKGRVLACSICEENEMWETMSEV